MKNKNLYKVRKNTIKDKATNVVLNVYYSIVRRERCFFGIIGPHVWKEYLSHIIGQRVKHHYSELHDAIAFKDRLNGYLIKVDIKTYNDSEILE